EDNEEVSLMTFQTRFPRRGDRTVRKAERQRLKAERRQLRAEVKEIKKKLRLEKRGLLWSGLRSSPSPRPRPLSATSEGGPGVSRPSLVPTMAALFLDENLPDGTRLQPGTKFIKYWKMRNSGTIGWTSETKLTFMWGNLGLASEEKREVTVPLLPPGQVGEVSVAFVAPVMEGTYTSHWRLAHCGCQFGPRVWCSIVVEQGDGQDEEVRAVKKDKGVSPKASSPGYSVDLNHEDFYFPSADLLTAQDLLSFELLDINIVQELETVPNNTPEDLTPCISPLPHDAPVLETPQSKEDGEVTGVRKLFGKSVKMSQQRELLEPVTQEEDREEEISGAQFLCETVIRSLALEEAPDHRPLRRAQHSGRKPQGEEPLPGNTLLWSVPLLVSSQTSSVSSCDDYIIILPDCFDTSRPLGESMYSSAVSQPDASKAATSAGQVNTWPPPAPPISSSVNQMLCASQTLDAVTLTPEVVPPPALYSPRLHRSAAKVHCNKDLNVTPFPHLSLLISVRLSGDGERKDPRICVICVTGTNCSLQQCYITQHVHIFVFRYQGGITEGLVKGALSVAASAYKALFTGPNSVDPAARQDPSMMAMLLEMGFRDQQLNHRLLKKHSYSLLHTINELVQMAEDSQNPAADTPH
uniref:Uncharacterized protein n=1 Tax=Mola mola TaxID=94237 RepID=A0A3Q4BYV4_MOLML